MRLLPLLAIAATLATAFAANEKKSPAEDQPIKIQVKQPAKLEAKDITVEEAEKLIASKPGLIIVDVRTPEEFETDHIKGALNINLHDPEFAKSVAALDQSKPVLFHCAGGRRSGQALNELAGKVKFIEAYHLKEGISAWKAAKKPVESKPLPRFQPKENTPKQ